MKRLLLLSALAGLLLGCHPLPRQATRPADSVSAVQAEREAQLGRRSHWRLTGRIAVSDGSDGGSGRIEWQQNGAHYLITLTAPVTGRSWRLSAGPGSARLDGLEGGPFEGQDASRLLHEYLGWNVPIEDLAAWARGMRAGTSGMIELTPSGLPALIEQHGWRIEYREFDGVGVEAMPRRVFATGGRQRVRLIVEDWSFPADG